MVPLLARRAALQQEQQPQPRALQVCSRCVGRCRAAGSRGLQHAGRSGGRLKRLRLRASSLAAGSYGHHTIAALPRRAGPGTGCLLSAASCASSTRRAATSAIGGRIRDTMCSVAGMEKGSVACAATAARHGGRRDVEQAQQGKGDHRRLAGRSTLGSRDSCSGGVACLGQQRLPWPSAHTIHAGRTILFNYSTRTIHRCLIPNEEVVARG